MTTAVFENEVVTAAKVRFLNLPGLSGEFALITIDNGHDHTRPSTFGPGGLASLDAALDDIAAHSPAPVAIGVTGKPFIFAVGADLSGVPTITDAGMAREIAETGHRVFRRLKDSNRYSQGARFTQEPRDATMIGSTLLDDGRSMP